MTCRVSSRTSSGCVRTTLKAGVSGAFLRSRCVQSGDIEAIGFYFSFTQLSSMALPSVLEEVDIFVKIKNDSIWAKNVIILQLARYYTRWQRVRCDAAKYKQGPLHDVHDITPSHRRVKLSF